MTNRFLYITTLFLAIHFSIFSQSTESLGDAGTRFSPGDVERVFVHTDRDIYISGEDLLFSVYLLDGKRPETKQENRSLIAYIELIDINKVPVAQLRCRINDGYGHGVLSIPDTIATGEYIFRAYTRYMRNYSPDIIFCKALGINNPLSSKHSIASTEDEIKPQANKPVPAPTRSTNITYFDMPESNFKPRETVTIKGRIDPASFNKAGLTRMSVSIAVSSGSDNMHNMGEYLLRYKAGSVNSEYINGLTSLNNHFKESYGPYIEGSVISRDGLLPEPNTRLYLSIPGKSPYFQYSVTNEKGQFRFVLPPQEGRLELILQASDFSDKHIIKISSPYADRSDNTGCGRFAIDKKFLEFGSRLGVNYQVNKIFEISRKDIKQDTQSIKLPDSFYGNPDIQVIMDNYINLPTMEEVFHELVPGVSLKKEGAGAVIVMSNILTGEKSSSPVKVFLDGVIMDNHSFIAGLDPELIERIEIIKRDYQYGNMIFKGIVSIVSREGDLCGIDYPNAGTRTAFEVLGQSYDYKNFIYSDTIPAEKYLPDFRSTIFWDPEIVPDKEGNFKFTFSTSDFISDYTITIQGITDIVEPIYLSCPISITKEE